MHGFSASDKSPMRISRLGGSGNVVCPVTITGNYLVSPGSSVTNIPVNESASHSNQERRRGAMADPSQFNIDLTHPGQWTITFSNPPINMFVPATIIELGALMTDLEADPSVKVVVFQPANPDFLSPIST